MNSSVYLVFAVLACIGTLCRAQVTCYECREETNPRASDCWVNPDGVTGENTVTGCETQCYSETFQSGGLLNDSSIWYISRGCSADVCVETENCRNKAFGTCRRCCTGEKCNVDSPSGSNVVKVSLLMLIAAAILGKWVA
ncbi:uncharacterized protein [Asterias amurensis]|uniref:uncharacterized protein n=1 Tax=Asterias amurensis TaxID=7602 RepID=UPI003AB61F93